MDTATPQHRTRVGIGPLAAIASPIAAGGARQPYGHHISDTGLDTHVAMTLASSRHGYGYAYPFPGLRKHRKAKGWLRGATGRRDHTSPWRGTKYRPNDKCGPRRPDPLGLNVRPAKPL